MMTLPEIKYFGIGSIMVLVFPFSCGFRLSFILGNKMKEWINLIKNVYRMGYCMEDHHE